MGEVVKRCETCGRPFTGRGRFDSEFCRRAKPCRTCGTLKTGLSPYCPDCQRDRLSGVAVTHDPEWLARQAARESGPKRKPAESSDSAGLWWCSGCRVWLSPRWFLRWKELQAGRSAPTLCRGCRSARSHASRIKADFGMSTADYEALLALQGGGCAICGGKPKTERLHVDHAHKEGGGDGKVRGLLCGPCNRELLVGIRHSARLAARAAMYLIEPPAQTGRAVGEVEVLRTESQVAEVSPLLIQ